MKRCVMSAGIILVMAVGIASAQSDMRPLPFDTAGAQRGVPPNAGPAPNARLVGGSVVWAHVVVYQESRPGLIEIRVHASDMSSQISRRVELPLAECPFELRVYETPHRTGRAVWSSDRAPHAIRCPRTLEDAVDASARFNFDDILGDSLPARRYYFRYAVRLANGERLEFADGESPLWRALPTTTRDWSTLRFTSGSEIAGAAPRMLTAWTTIRNTGTRTVKFAHGACSLDIRLWRTPARSGKPAWISEARAPIQPKGRKSPMGYGCPLPLYVRNLPPNDTLTFRLQVPLPEVLEDTLPEGEYWVGVELGLLNDSLRPPQWETKYKFPAGAVTLRRSPDRPPSVRQDGPFRFEAATRLVRRKTPGTDSVRTFVLVTNVSAESAELEIWPGKPLTVYVFRSEEERDAYPTPTAAYTTPPGIHTATPQRNALGAGQKWLFEQAVAVKDLVDRVGRGRVYLLAWVTGRPGTMLAAGDIDVP